MSTTLQEQFQLSSRLYASDPNDEVLELAVINHLKHLDVKDERNIPPFLSSLENASTLIPKGWKMTMMREGNYVDAKTGKREFICFLSRNKGSIVAKGNALSDASALTVSILKADAIDKMTLHDDNRNNH